jgi:hypothetical protein
MFILCPPEGDYYEILVSLCTYPEWIFLGLTVVGLLWLRITRPEVHRPVKSYIVAYLLFVFVCLALAILPFIPPKNNVDAIPYYVVPSTGLILILSISVIWLLYSKMVEGANRVTEDIFEQVLKINNDEMSKV